MSTEAFSLKSVCTEHTQSHTQLSEKLREFNVFLEAQVNALFGLEIESSDRATFRAKFDSKYNVETI